MENPTAVQVQNAAAVVASPAPARSNSGNKVEEWRSLKLPMSPNSNFRLNPGLSIQQTESRAKAERNLWYWNLCCAIVHGAQAIAALVLALKVVQIGNFKLPLTTIFLE